MAIKIKGRNGNFLLDQHRVVVGRDLTAVYFWSSRIGNESPSAFLGPVEDVVALLDDIRAQIIAQKLGGKSKPNPQIGYSQRPGRGR